MSKILTVEEAETTLNTALEYFAPHYTSGTPLKAREVTEAVRGLIRAVLDEERLAFQKKKT